MCNVLKKTSSTWCWLYIFFVFNFIPNCVVGFNLDLSNFIRHSRDPGSMFGFSIAVHRNTGTSAKNWVIVGAPKYNDTAAKALKITELGGVFRCDILDDDRCVLIPFDSKGNQFNDRNEQIDTKSYQWLGATVASGGENGPIVACAPRYVFHTMQPSRMERIEPVGTCFTAKDFRTFTEFSPCRTNYWGYHRQGSCQAGFSAAITKNNQRLFIGAPGSWYWQGQVYSINTAGQFPYKPPLYQEFGAGQMFGYDVTNPQHKVYATGESSSSYDDSYFGYSVTTGDFNGDGTEGVAVGMPRGSGLYGRVAIYSWKLDNLLNITGTQIGSYFGYSLCSVDVDGDKLDDLIIGAPMHAEPNNEGKYDVGRVYVMLQKQRNKFFTNETRDGVNSRGRFGLSVASLRDVNLDGYGDFAVGAPYDGPNNNGAVYIFYGSPTGPLKKPSQVIFAEDLISIRYPKTFGFSLAGGIDLDGNLYPDLSVGAYESDSIFVFKARPVAVVEANTTLLSYSKLVNLDEKQCTVPYDNKPVTCTDLKSCIKYDGINLPPMLEFDVSWALDSKKSKNPRMFFLNDRHRNIHNRTYTLYRGRVECLNETIYIADGIVDKLTPLEVEMRYQLRHNQVPTINRRPRDVPQPIIDYNRETILRDSINIQKNCGSDAICTPDLQLQIKTVDKYLLGSKEPLSIDVSVSNVLEDAFEATFYMTVPPDLDYISTRKIGDSRDTSISCTAPSIHTNNVLICRLGNPFAAGKVVNFRIGMKPPPNRVLPPSYDFYMEANSTNPEMGSTRHDNVIKKNIGMWVKTELSIEGTSDPSFDYYQVSDYKNIENATAENEIGPNIVHIYNIRNNGPSAIEQAEVYIFWPYKTHSGDHLMYLLQNPELSGNIQCDPNIYVNEENLKLDPELSKKSYLRTAGVVLKAYAGHQNELQGGRIDHSYSSGTSSGGAVTGTRFISEEERKKLEEEATIESPGDASFVHSERTKATASNQNAGQVVRTSSMNRTITYDSSGNPHVVESSTEYYLGGSAGSPTYYANSDQTYTPSQSGYSVYTGSSSYPAGTSSQFSRSSSNARDYNQGYGQQGHWDYQGSQNTHPIPVVTNLEKAAQGGEGFQAGVVNLEPIYRQSVDDDIRARGQPPYPQGTGQTHYSQGSYSSQSGHGGTHDSRPVTQYHQTHTISRGGQPISVHHTSTRTDRRPDIDQEGYYDDDDRDTHYTSRSYGRHNIDNRRTPESYQRLRRQAQARPNFDEEIENTVHCKATRCAMIRCMAGPLVGENVAWIAIRTRLVAHTLTKITSDVPLNVSTMAVARVTRLPHIGERKDKPISFEILYTAMPQPQPKSDMVPLWVVVLSACAGAIILLLLAFLLYKCGFFDRNRPSDSQERQPLNSRNGYHGDEHL